MRFKPISKPRAVTEAIKIFPENWPLLGQPMNDNAVPTTAA
jgi:hypothetical protein